MKKRKHRPFTLFLCLLLWAFIVFGPFYFIKFKPDTTGQDAKRVQQNWKGIITLWDYPRLDITNGSKFGWIMSKIKAFERANPGVYIELKPLDWQSGSIELETAVQMKTYPDIAPVGSNYSVISQNVLEPLDPYFSRSELDDYKPQALSAVRYNEKIWGIPWMMTTYTMLLNLDLFHEKGVSPPQDGNWTYDEFVKILKTLTYDRDEDGKNDVYGFHSFIDLHDYNTWGILLSDGAEIFDQNRQMYCFNDQRAASGIKKLVDLKLVHGVTPESFGENSEQEAWDLFCRQKKVAVYPAGAWTINELNHLKNKGAGFEFGVANYPIGEEGVPVSMTKNDTAYGIFKQTDNKKLEMCVKFLKFITQDKYQMELDRLGVFPAKKSVGQIYKNDRMMSIVEKSLVYTRNIPAHPQWPTIEGLIQSQIRQVLLGNKSVEEALKDAEMKIQLFMKTHRKMMNSR